MSSDGSLLVTPSDSLQRALDSVEMASTLADQDAKLGTDTYVVSITGPRGSGKTTLMRSILQTLSLQKKFVILPVIEPEFFGTNDTILGHVIAAIRRMILQTTPETMQRAVQLPPELGVAPTLGGMLERLLRDSYQIAGSSDIPASSLDQQRMDFARLMGFGESFRQLLQTTVDAVVTSYSTPRHQPSGILVPIDDPDLRPELITTILQHIRILAGTQRVVVISCYSEDQARPALAGLFMRTTGLERDQAFRAADLHLFKTFPPYLRAELASLPLSERLEFCPAGRTLPLRDLLRAITLPTAQVKRLNNMLDLLWPGNDFSTPSRFSFLDALPENPRELVTLYFNLEATIREQATSEIVFARSAKQIFDAGLRATRYQDPESVVLPQERIRLQPQLHSDKPLLLIDFTDISMKGTLQAFKAVITLPSGVRMHFASMGPVRGQTEKGGGTFDNGVIAALLLAREATHLTSVFEEQAEGGTPVYGGVGRQNLIIDIHGSRSDGEFIALPAWESYGDAFIWDAAWRSFLDQLQDVVAGRLPDPVSVPWLVLGFHVNAVLGLLYERQVPRLDRSVLANALVDDNLVLAQAYLNDALTVMVDMASAIHDPGTTPREADFLGWIDLNLPQFLHPALTPPEIATQVMRARGEALSGHRNDSTTGLAVRLGRRVRGYLGESWIDGLLEFGMAEILPFQNLSELRQLHDSAKAQRLRANRLHAPEEGVAGPPSLERPPAYATPRDPGLAIIALDNLIRRVADTA